MTIFGLNIDGLGADSHRAKIQRALVGAFYGLLGGSTFVVVAGFIDIWLNPHLPLGVNWDAFLFRLPLIGLGLALIGAVTCWWHEAWQGLLSGSVLSSVLTLTVALFSSQVGTGIKFIVLVFILVPIAVMTLPVAYLLRWLVERHGRALQAKWTAARILGLILLVVALGGGAGYLMKTPVRGIESSRFIHDLLRDLSTEANPLATEDGIPERSGVPYTLFAIASQVSNEGWEVHVDYEDGYHLQCEVILYPGSEPFLGGCRSGDDG
jgi:hypothetical protein